MASAGIFTEQQAAARMTVTFSGLSRSLAPGEK
jgi:hypothetical protein